MWILIVPRFAMFIHLAILVGVVSMAGGCGTSPESGDSSKSAVSGNVPISQSGLSQSDSKPSDGADSTPANSGNGVDHIDARSPVHTADGGFAQSETRQPAEKSKADSSSSVEQFAPEVAEPPTPEQLARWTAPAHEPLQMLACRESGSIGLVATMAQPGDGRHFLLAGKSVTLWSIEADAPEHVLFETSDDPTIKSLAASPDGKWFAVGDSDGTLRIWSIADRTESISKQLNSNDIIDIAISPDSREIAIISYDDEVTIWSADLLQEKNRFKVNTNGLKRIVYLTPELLAAAGETTTLWNVVTGKLEQTLSPGRYYYSLARSPDDTRFIFGEQDALQLWNISAKTRESKLVGGFATEELIAFSGDGKRLATANQSAVRLWDSENGQLLQVIDAYGWPIVGLNWLPETNLLVIASQNGRTRIWGTQKNGEAVGLQPLHGAVILPDAGLQQPATPSQLRQMIDLRLFPRLPGGTASGNDPFTLSYAAPVSQKEATLFNRYQLSKAGWKEVAAATPGSTQFQKEGFLISASFYDDGQSGTFINLSFSGNYDLRRIPRIDSTSIETVFENEQTVMYRTKAKLLEIETALLRKLHEAGWTAFARLHTSHSENEDGRDLQFLRDGLTLRVLIGRVPADSDSYTVQYSGMLLTKTIPVPSDSGFVEFAGATQPYLVATTVMSLDEAREFYDTELKAQGWLVRDFGRSLHDDQVWLSYIRSQEDLTIGLLKMESGRTLVRVGDDLEKYSWQLAMPKPEQTADQAATKLEAADFPILNASKTAEFDAVGKTLDFSMDTIPLSAVAEKYTTELQTLGWTWDGGGIKSDDYVFLTFTRDKAEIALRARIKDGKSSVNIQGDGLVWTKPLPGPPKVISYETWLRSNHHPATLDLLDVYEAEMRALKI